MSVSLYVSDTDYLTRAALQSLSTHAHTQMNWQDRSDRGVKCHTDRRSERGCCSGVQRVYKSQSSVLI